MTFIEKLKESSADKASSIVIGAVTGLAIIVGNALSPDVIPMLSSPRLQKVVVPILGISLIVNLLLGYLLLELSRKPKFKTRLGFFWDSDLQPHCPACESPMQWGNWAGTNGPGLLCGKCKNPRYLTDDNGNHILIEEARKLLKQE